jgi:hypothetical protein
MIYDEEASFGDAIAIATATLLAGNDPDQMREADAIVVGIVGEDVQSWARACYSMTNLCLILATETAKARAGKPDVSLDDIREVFVDLAAS